MWALLVAVTLSQAPTGDVRAEARRLFVEGERHFEAHAWDDATSAFRASYALKPSAATAWNLAQCAELSNHPAASIGWYRRYLALDPTAKDKAQVGRAIRAQEKKLAARLVQAMTVFLEPASAVALVDGERLVDGATIELSPGRHQVSVSAPGFVGVQREVELSATASQEARFVLEAAPRDADQDFTRLPPQLASATDTPLDEPVAQPLLLKPLPSWDPTAVRVEPPRAEPRPHRFRVTWVGAGLTAAGVLTGVIAGAIASAASAQLRDGSVRSGDAATRLKDQVGTGATVANGGWIAAGVGAVGTAIAVGVEW